MKKLITLIFSLLITFNVLANDWPHQNISKAVFALDIKDRALSILLKSLTILWVKSIFLQISATFKVSELRIAGYTKTK